MESQQQPRPNARTVKPNGEKIRTLRIAKGWRAEDLARKALMSTKTVDSVEKGLDVYLATLAKVARAFQLNPTDLLVGSVAATNTGGSATKKKIRMILHATIDFDDFNESSELLGLFSKFLKSIKGEIDLNGCSEGDSVRLDIEVDEDDARTMVQLFCDARGPREIDAIVFPDTDAFAETIARGVVSAVPRLSGSFEQVKQQVLAADTEWCHWFVVHFPNSAVLLEVDRDISTKQFRLKLEEVPAPPLSDPLRSRKQGNWGGS